jgi:hypothetical protein
MGEASMDMESPKTLPDGQEPGKRDSISRRDALKRMAKIALGLGAAGILPAALSRCSYEDYDDYYDYYSNSYSDYYYHHYDDYYDYYDYYSNYYS